MEPSLFLREMDKESVRTIGNVPRYAPVRNSSRNSSALPFAPVRGMKNEVENRAGWRKGERLFHDDHGYGEVTEVRDSEDGPVVRVRFETGKEMRFLAKHQAGSFVKIGHE
jgi:DNA helicase-2/ATP-dependent DNA helicase PcrA